MSSFIRQYKDFIVHESPTKAQMRCIHPWHIDEKPSAVYFKNTGIYFCIVCGSKKIGEQDLTGDNPIHSKDHKFYFDTNAHPLHYAYIGSSIMFANIVDDEITGITTRFNNRSIREYRTVGEVGFRTFAPVQTESCTDALVLLESGIDAGSVGNASQAYKISENQIYIPQYDNLGIEAGATVDYTQGVAFWWKNYIFGAGDYKDISELKQKNARAFQNLVNLLADTYSLPSNNKAIGLPNSPAIKGITTAVNQVNGLVRESSWRAI